MKNNRLIDIDEMINTPEKLEHFIERTLVYKTLLMKIKVQRNYKSFEMARLIFVRERLYE